MALTTRSGFYRREGKPRAKKFLVGGSVTVAVGDIMEAKEGSGSILLHAAAGNEVLGVALEASVSGSTAPILIDLIYPGDIFEANIEVGTMAAGEILDEADMNSEDGLTLTESSGDCTIVGWDGINTDKCYVVFNNCDFGSPGVNVD